MKAVMYDNRISPNALVLSEVEKPIPSNNGVFGENLCCFGKYYRLPSMKIGIFPTVQ